VSPGEVVYVIPAMQGRKEEDHGADLLGYKVRPVLKTTNTKRAGSW
jgi:hypothetical protein